VEKDPSRCVELRQCFNMTRGEQRPAGAHGAELIDYAEKKPGEAPFERLVGGRTTGHWAGELFKAMTGLRWVHVP